MPWHHDGSSISRPKNVASAKGYRGMNVLALWAAAHYVDTAFSRYSAASCVTVVSFTILCRS
jgi:antirestriction protein ArdC